MPSPIRRRSAFAGVLLLLYLVAVVVHLWLVGTKAPLAWEVGSFLFAGLILIGGVCTAFVRGGFIVRSFAVACGLLCGLNIVGAVITVLGGALERREGTHDVSAEAHDLTLALATEMDSKDLTAAVHRQFDRQSAAVDRLRSSDNPYTVVMGEAMAMQQDILHAPTLRLTQVGVDLASKRFTDVPAMIADGDCSWHIRVSREYAGAVKNMQDACEVLPGEIRHFLSATDLPPADAEDFVRGMTDAIRDGQELFACHARMAEAHTAYFRFVEEHLDEMRVSDAGVVIGDERTRSAYEDLFERRLAAGRELNAKLRTEKQRMAKR